MKPQRTIPIASAQPSLRQCGTCRACCEGWAAGNIRGYEMFPGKPCHFLGAEGCTIYDTRPVEPCRNFVCGWLALDSPFPEEFRPNRLGVIIVPIRWREQPAYILLPAGKDPDDALITWMSEFGKRTGRPFFFSRGSERFGFGPPEFQRDMLALLASNKRLW